MHNSACCSGSIGSPGGLDAQSPSMMRKWPSDAVLLVCQGECHEKPWPRQRQAFHVGKFKRMCVYQGSVGWKLTCQSSTELIWSDGRPLSCRSD